MTETMHSEVIRSGNAEIRTFLIADVRGYTRFTVEHGDEAAASLAARFAEVVEETVAGCDGTLTELRGDEALAVFTSARQALRAGVHLQERFSEEVKRNPALPLQVGIGLDAGEAIPVKDGYRGGALNLAARLCSLAGPGEVLASDGVIHLARKIDGLSYAERGLVQLKGFADPVRVIQVSSRDGEESTKATVPRDRPLPIGGFLGALPSGVLVARADEMRTIVAAIEAVAGGSGRLILLAGEPGVGKTRLAQEATLIARNRGFLVASGRCYASREGVPYYPFLDALATAYGDAPPDLRSTAARQWPYLARLLPDELGPQVTSSGEGQDEQERLFRAVTGFLAALTESTPVALLLDDLHWADQATLDLLQHVARHTRADRLLLLGTYRDVEVGRQHPLERGLRDLHREQLVERVAVQRLERDETVQLIATTLGEEGISRSFADLVHRHTDGNPFFTQEVLRTLVERGDVFLRDGVWDRRGIEEIEVPESVRSAIGERLARLGEEAGEVLYAASVLGQTFAFDDLERMTGRSVDELEEALEGAVAVGLIREAGSESYAFNHALTQQSLYGEISARKKRRLHGAAGEALERLPGRVQEKRVAELAWHFLQGDDADRALHYALRAGDHAASVFAHAEAQGQYETALELAREQGTQPQEAEALEKLGNALSWMGKYDRALELLDRAAELRRAGGDLLAEGQVVAQIGRVHARRVTNEDGIARVTTFLERIGNAGFPGVRAQLYSALTHLYFASGRYSEQQAAAERASDLAREIGDDRLLVDTEHRRALALSMLGDRSECLHVWEQVIPLAERVGDLYNLSHALNVVGFLYVLGGQLDRGKRYVQRALETAERLSDPVMIGFMSTNLAEIGYWSGEWNEARSRYEEYLQLAEETEESWLTPYPLSRLGGLCLVMGKWEEASDHLEKASAITDRTGDMQARRLARNFLAIRDVLDGQPASALHRLEPVLGTPYPDESDVTFLLPVVAQAQLDLGDAKGASETVAIGIQRAEQQENRLCLVEMRCVQGIVLTHEEQWDEAQRTFEDAVAVAHSIPYPYAEALSLYHYGVMHLRKGDREAARGRLGDALQIFQRLGAQPYVERKQQALEGLDDSAPQGT